ncbi:response regulator [Microbaculum marinum]|uniref:Response regulator n=1 Tax=Microbaculum marinum TaxID=1764581 RepID=A0AAW9RT01_9HYPH
MTGGTILIVEDEFLIADAISDVVSDHGYRPLGPVATLQEALLLVRDTRPDAALLNLVLNGERADPLCELLDSLGVPFGFATGVDGDADPGMWRDRPRIVKPYTLANLSELIAQLLPRRP